MAGVWETSQNHCTSQTLQSDVLNRATSNDREAPKVSQAQIFTTEASPQCVARLVVDEA